MARQTWAHICTRLFRTDLNELCGSLLRFLTIPVLILGATAALFACAHETCPACDVHSGSRGRDLRLSELFNRGERSLAVEAKMRPLIEKHATTGSYDFECRDRVCRIRPNAPGESSRLMDALHAVSRTDDRRLHMLISSIDNHFDPYVVYWLIADEAALTLHDEMRTKIVAQVASPCKRQHPQRGTIDISVKLLHGEIRPVTFGELAETPIGECIRSGLNDFLLSTDFPSGALPFSATLKLMLP
jgi:hypothetical protein